MNLFAETPAAGPLTWDSVIKIAAAALTFATALAGTAIGLAKYFSSQTRSLDSLRQEIKDLKLQTKILKQPLELETAAPSTLFQQLLSASTEARDAVAADIHSISVPVPQDRPTHLRIILSTDAEAEKVVGREFPINKGIAGWVFQRKEATFKNPQDVDPRHFGLVDKAAGTHTGRGAILSVPLLSGGACWGVIQFMKSRGGSFSEADLQIATRVTPRVTRLLADLQNSSTADIPSVAHGAIKNATIVFTDITGYVEVAKKLRLSDTVGMLNEYYMRLLQAALSRGAKLEEYLGDGLFMSFFGDVASQAAVSAVRAAFDMQSEYLQILQGWEEFQHPVSHRNFHRIGIASGNVYVGLVGHPEQRRAKIVGPAVDQAAHLCEDIKAIGGGVAICPATKDLTGNEWHEFQRRTLAHGEAWVVATKQS